MHPEVVQRPTQNFEVLPVESEVVPVVRGQAGRDAAVGEILVQGDGQTGAGQQHQQQDKVQPRRSLCKA